MTTFEHGLNGYKRRLCRCDVCRAANTAQYKKLKEQRSKGPVPENIHGKYTTYQNWKCRCADCTEAFRVRQREYLDRKKKTNKGGQK